MAIVLSFLITLILPFYKHHFLRNEGKNIVLGWGIAGLIVFAIILLFNTGGRSGWMGFIGALVFIIYNYTKQILFRKRLLKYGLMALLILFPLLLWYKYDSSSGRILIYKISGKLLRDNWLWGIGHDQFKVEYNLYQSQYFQNSNIDSKEALLSDNSFYVFNDSYQLLIENGIIGIGLAILAIYFLVKQLKSVNIPTEHRYVFVAASASLISIIIASLFSYPFQIFSIIVFAVICLALINSFGFSQNENVFVARGKVLKISMVLISFSIICHSFAMINYKIESKNAFMLSQTGCKIEALKIYDKLTSGYIKDGNILYLYAKHLYNSNKLTEALEVITKARKYLSNNKLYSLNAMIALELKDYKEAERLYKLALYMTPNKMGGRSDLLNYYVSINDTMNVIRWCESILNMPVKIPSSTTENIQYKTKLLLKLFKGKQN